jgi:two-component system, sensor histidine kinase ChiS
LFLKSFYKRITALPPNVPKEHHQWLIFANFIDLFGIGNCLVNLPLNIYLKQWWVVILELTVLISFFTALQLQLRGIYKICIPLVYTVLGGGAFLGVFLSGWHAGFQYYLLALTLGIFYVPFYSRFRIFTIVSILLAGFFTSFIAIQQITPFYELPAVSAQILYILNTGGLIFSILYFPSVQQNALKITSQELSRSKEQNQELTRLASLKDDFLANTSHELRTPLHGISGIAESLLHDSTVTQTPFLRTNLEHIIISARRLTTLVNDILDFSKMKHNELTLHPHVVDLQQITHAVLPNFTTLATKKGLTLTCDFLTKTPYIWADEDRVIQILFNLIGNALKFTDTGCISIGAKSTEDTVTLSVSDTGMGIAPDNLPRIFDTFEQLQSQRNNYRGGTGLGLSITKKLVELMKGTITVNSTVGVGSTFFVTFPAQNKSQHTEETQPGKMIKPQFISEPIHWHNEEKEMPCAQNTPCTVIAIDDEPINLQIIQNYLKQEQVRVITAESGNDILTLIATHQPSLILLDIMMPGLNGYEICKIIRSHYSSLELPIIFISAKNRINDLILGFQAGANDYVLKPFLREELLARANGLIHQRLYFITITENSKLKQEVANHLLQERELRYQQDRLSRMLHTVDTPIILTDELGVIVFANTALVNTLGGTDGVDYCCQSIGSLLHPKSKHKNLLTAKISTNPAMLYFLHSNGSEIALGIKRTILNLDSEQYWVFSFCVKDTGQEIIPNWIIKELEKNQNHLNALESQLQCMTNGTAIKESLINCIELQRSIYESLSSNANNPSLDPQTLAHNIMTKTIELWTLLTDKDKKAFATESALWKTHADENGWERTTTLDRYLDPRKLPKFPRWSVIVESAEYVLNLNAVQKYNHNSPLPLELSLLLEKIPVPTKCV